MKKSIKGIALAMSMLMCSSFGVSVSAASEIAINATNFPDEVFRKYVSRFDKDSSGGLSESEIISVTEIDVSGTEENPGKIQSLKGLEYFTALQELNFEYNQLTSLDVSKNTALFYLRCSENQLTNLNVCKNTALKYLFCYKNQLKCLDVSKNTALTRLDCDYNQLTSLDVSKNTALESLWCYDNQLTSLDVSKNTALKVLWCYDNQLTSLDVSKNAFLTELFCNNNQLTSLDASQNTALIWVNCFENQLSYLNVSGCTSLWNLFCYDNKLTNLILRNNTALEVLSCGSNQLSNLDLSQATALKELWCSNNQLTSLDVRKNIELTSIDCSNNQLTSFDLTNNSNWITAYTEDNSYYIGNIGNSYSLANLPYGFDISRAFNWVGAELDGDKLINITGINGEKKIQYNYWFADGFAYTVTLTYGVDDTQISTFVNRLYTILLGRNAEPAGLADWTNRLKSGTATSAEIVSGIAGSQEFANFGLSNEEIVERMYQAMLGRPSDPAGKASWLNALDSGMTINGIINGFSGSQEFGQICTGYGIQAGSITNAEPRDKSAGLTSFTARMYMKALGRTYDITGLNDWTNRYLTGEAKVRDIAFGFIFSPEFVNKGLSDSDYVDTLYRTFFNREPDEGGKADWMSKLANGTPREAVLDGFVGSQECANLVASFGIG